jgi:hypothetical protein
MWIECILEQEQEAAMEMNFWLSYEVGNFWLSGRGISVAPGEFCSMKLAKKVACTQISVKLTQFLPWTFYPSSQCGFPNYVMYNPDLTGLDLGLS